MKITIQYEGVPKTIDVRRSGAAVVVDISGEDGRNIAAMMSATDAKVLATAIAEVTKER